MPSTRKATKSTKSAGRTRKLSPREQAQLVRFMMRYKGMAEKAMARQRFMRSLNAQLHRRAVSKALAAATRRAAQSTMKEAEMKEDQILRRSARVAAKSAVKNEKGKVVLPAVKRSVARSAAVKPYLYPSILAGATQENIKKVNKAWKERMAKTLRSAKIKAEAAANAAPPAAAPAAAANANVFERLAGSLAGVRI